MVSSILTPTCSFLSNSTTDPSSPSPRSSKFLNQKRCRYPYLKVVGSGSRQGIEDGSVEQFQGTNSIGDFMRFQRGSERGTGDLQTAVVSYKKRFPWSLLQPFFQVDLVSTIHIGDKEYFETLQRKLESYDCVLYETVATRESLENGIKPSATRRLKSSRSRGFNIVGWIQKQMARVLALDFQLDCLDYDGDKWQHADLDFETFELLLEKGESIYTFARDMTLKSTNAIVESAAVPEGLDPWRSKLLWASRVLPMPLVGLLIISGVCADVVNPVSDNPEFEALSRLDLSAALKVFLAKRLTSEFSEVTTDVEEKSVIVGERNRAALEALRRSMDKGSNKMAILYGGGHMPDLGRRLREEFDLIPSEVQWVTAWSIRNRDLQSSSIPFLRTMARVLGWPLNRYQTAALVIFSCVLALDLWFWELFFGTAVDWISHAASDVLEYIG